MPISDDRSRVIFKAIDQLYEAACNPARWPVFLESARTRFNAQGAQIGHHDLVNYSLSFSRVAGYEWSADHYRKYDALMPQDPRIAFFVSNPHKAVHCRMGIEEHVLHASEVYQEVLRPGGVEYSLGVNLSRDNQALSYFLALRSPGQPCFDKSDCELLDELVPHLARALLLQREVRTLDFEKQILSDAMDNMAIGLMIVDKGARIKFANVTARETIETEVGLYCRNNRISARGKDGQALHALVHKIVTLAETTDEDVDAPTIGETMFVARRGDMSPLALFICPLFVAGDPGWGRKQEPLAVVVVKDENRPIEMMGSVLMRLFGLTQSQARLASLISTGSPLQRAAQELGITEASARQYLKVIFEKMDVTRQGELIIKTMNLPLPKKSGSEMRFFGKKPR